VIIDLLQISPRLFIFMIY